MNKVIGVLVIAVIAVGAVWATKKFFPTVLA